MAEEHQVWTKNDKFYRIRKSGGYFYVSQPGRSMGWTKTMADALAMVENDSGSEVRSVS
jgi:hypothetical protein